MRGKKYPAGWNISIEMTDQLYMNNLKKRHLTKLDQINMNVITDEVMGRESSKNEPGAIKFNSKYESIPSKWYTVECKLLIHSKNRLTDAERKMSEQYREIHPKVIASQRKLDQNKLDPISMKKTLSNNCPIKRD